MMLEKQPLLAFIRNFYRMIREIESVAIEVWEQPVRDFLLKGYPGI